MQSEPEPVDDDLADEAGELILEANEQLEQRRAEQEAFLETVAEEKDVEVLETPCNILGDYTVTVRAELNGHLMDRIGDLMQQLEAARSGDLPMYESGNLAEDISDLLADVIVDDGWTANRFYAAYEQTTLEALGEMLVTAFTALSEERERRSGAADGFRQE